MSRIGKQPVVLPPGVNAIIESSTIRIEGPKGKLSMVVNPSIELSKEGNVLHVKRTNDSLQAKASHGCMRARINGMVLGVTKGWNKQLSLTGVGFNAKLQANVLVLSVGFSHDVKMALPTGITCAIEKNLIKLESADKEQLGTFAAKVRAVQPPEPYLGKGIAYVGEKIRRKQGKTVKK